MDLDISLGLFHLSLCYVSSTQVCRLAVDTEFPLCCSCNRLHDKSVSDYNWSAPASRFKKLKPISRFPNIFSRTWDLGCCSTMMEPNRWWMILLCYAMKTQVRPYSLLLVYWPTRIYILQVAYREDVMCNRMYISLHIHTWGKVTTLMWGKLVTWINLIMTVVTVCCFWWLFIALLSSMIILAAGLVSIEGPWY